MKQYKEYTLLTLEQFRERFKSIAIVYMEHFDEYELVCIEIEMEKLHWYISGSSIERFGTIVKAKKTGAGNFTHLDIDGSHLYHESWFEPDTNFITEEEMML